MFTEVHFTNSVALPGRTINFFHEDSGSIRSFKEVRCQFRWSHSFRIPWTLSFRLVRPFGNRTIVFDLKALNYANSQRVMLSGEGILIVNKFFKKNKQLIEFNQAKGNQFCGVQIYRGELLIAEKNFTGKLACFEIDEIVSASQFIYDHPKKSLSPPELTFPLSGVKELYLGIDPASDKIVVHDWKSW